MNDLDEAKKEIMDLKTSKVIGTDTGKAASPPMFYKVKQPKQAARVYRHSIKDDIIIEYELEEI
jgi:hypothetical protein